MMCSSVRLENPQSTWQRLCVCLCIYDLVYQHFHDQRALRYNALYHPRQRTKGKCSSTWFANSAIPGTQGLLSIPSTACPANLTFITNDYAPCLFIPPHYACSSLSNFYLYLPVNSAYFFFRLSLVIITFLRSPTSFLLQRLFFFF